MTRITRQDQAAATCSPRGTALSNSGVVVVAIATSGWLEASMSDPTGMLGSGSEVGSEGVAAGDWG